MHRYAHGPSWRRTGNRLWQAALGPAGSRLAALFVAGGTQLEPHLPCWATYWVSSLSRTRARWDDGAFHALPNADRIAYRALKNALSELGEAVKALPREVTERHPDVDWRGFGGLRDVVAHGYFGLRQELLWPIVREEVPRLLASVEAELKGPG